MNEKGARTGDHMSRSQRQRTPVVGVGASAGGVEALEGFFRGVPNDPGFGVVVVTHLSPGRESHLHEIIARHTNLSVQKAKQGAQVKPNCVYVLSSRAVIGIEGGRLQIRASPTVRPERKPIDVFLSALAKDLGDSSAAVILSGGDGDGTLGVKAIKERGGLTMAQVHNGDGPSHPDMPDSAISTGFVDFAIPAHEMGSKLAEFARGLTVLYGMADDELANGESANERQEIYTILRNQVGHDFSGYKPNTFMRRVQRRMHVLQLDTLEAYVEQLRQDPREVNALFRDLLINVTNFFRDGEAFEQLKQVVIPKLFEKRNAEDTVRVWVPGCATGEEVFSVAILLREHMDTLSIVPRVQIFATDIDERALNVARAARYPDALLDTVSPERLKRFFIKDGGSYVVSKDVRDLCIFSPHSVTRDPPFSRIDLVSCRNLLIYFGPQVQSQVIPTFHYSLREGGYLFLGASENVSQFADLFTPLDKKHRIFRAKEDHLGAARIPLALSGLRPALKAAQPRMPATRSLGFRQSVESHVLERFAPAHVVTDREGEIVYYSSRTGKYLEAAPGAPTRLLFTLARKGLRLDLRAAFREAVESGHAASREHIEVENEEGRVQFVSITIEPLAAPHADEPLFVILFNDEGPVLTREAASRAQNRADITTAQLEAELRDTRERLQSVVEEYETALEELKSSNEELVSVNEELQSTNEELEASKEELQSLNEEMHTVNAELNGKVDALDAANNDLHNLFDNTQVAIIFLDRDLKIRSFTPAVSQVFNILPSDRGRPLTDLSSPFPLPQLGKDIKAAMDEGKVAERRMAHDAEDKHFLVRVGPYRDAGGVIDGAVVAFVDVTSLTAAEDQQRVLIRELDHRVKNMLARVLALVHISQRDDLAPSEALAALESRIRAMARTHDLLAPTRSAGVRIEDICTSELAPYKSGGNISVSGASAPLKMEAAQTFTMVVHELATNAAKHGALSQPKGKVQVQIGGANGAMTMTWEESDGPRVSPPKHESYGLKIIQNAIVREFGGAVDISFPDPGLRCKITAPLDKVSA
jgi:two-component system, chemotaxis family, CheB/CheR fusion protein